MSCATVPATEPRIGAPSIAPRIPPPPVFRMSGAEILVEAAPLTGMIRFGGASGAEIRAARAPLTGMIVYGGASGAEMRAAPAPLTGMIVLGFGATGFGAGGGLTY